VCSLGKSTASGLPQLSWANEVSEQNRHALGECSFTGETLVSITGETLVPNTDVVVLQPLLLVEVLMPPAALYATIAAIAAAAQSNKFHLTSCRFFLFTPACFESNVREVMQASLILVEWQLTGRLRIYPRRHTTAVPKVAKVFQAIIQALHPGSYHVQDGIISSNSLPIEQLSALKACSGDRKFTKACAESDGGHPPAGTGRNRLTEIHSLHFADKRGATQMQRTVTTLPEKQTPSLKPVTASIGCPCEGYSPVVIKLQAVASSKLMAPAAIWKYGEANLCRINAVCHKSGTRHADSLLQRRGFFRFSGPEPRGGGCREG